MKRVKLVSATERSIQPGFNERKVSIKPGVKFFIAPRGETKSDGTVPICLEILEEKAVVDLVYEFEDCPDLEMLTPDNLAVSLKQMLGVEEEERQQIFRMTTITAVNELIKSAELELDIDSFHEPTRATFALRVGSFSTFVRIPYREVKGIFKIIKDR